MNLGLASALLCLAPLAATAQDLVIPPVTIPKLPATAASVNGFVPPGWKLTCQVTGDLNADGKADVLFILLDTDPKNIINTPDVSGFDTNPRILAAAFANASSPGYTLAFQNAKFIARSTDPDNFASAQRTPDCDDTPLSIAHGAFSIEFPTPNQRNVAPTPSALSTPASS
jgi:hypothetical protein